MPLTPDQFSKYLADETRARIALLVAGEKELCVCELTCALDETQPKISRHLAQLRTGGVLADRRQGQWVYYRLHPNLPEWALKILLIMREAHGEWLAPNVNHLCAMEDRPTRCCPQPADGWNPKVGRTPADNYNNFLLPVNPGQ